MIQISQMKCRADHGSEEPVKKALKLLKLSEASVKKVSIWKRSIDARKKPEIYYIYTMMVETGWNRQKEEQLVKKLRNKNIVVTEPMRYQFPAGGSRVMKHRPVIIGMGPTGMFCALLLARAGYRPLVLERGQAVEQRIRTVEYFWKTGELDPECNVQFGEGGAGTFSDGKLNTMVKDPAGRGRKVLELFVEAGAPEDILYVNKPHIGTDVLQHVVARIRSEIQKAGGTVVFQTRVSGLRQEKGQITGVEAEVYPEELQILRREYAELLPVRTKACCSDTDKYRDTASRVDSDTDSVQENRVDSDKDSVQENITDSDTDSVQKNRVDSNQDCVQNCGNPKGAKNKTRVVIPAEQVVLAIGHSSRDTFAMLKEMGIPMEAKSFAVGFRIEHPQSMLNHSQYGLEHPGHLPAADYKLTYRASNGRGVYSFCMCPGGHVVNSSSEPGRLTVNGMSYRARDGKNANSALIVTVTPEDYPGQDVLAGMAFQRQLEEAAWRAGNGKIPCQTFGDFRDNRPTVQLGEVEPQHKGESALANLRGILPGELEEALIEGIESFEHKIKGFSRPDAVLSGVEARTSSPVKILRDEKLMSQVRGLYPCGEGPGYAGGIMSAAMDGCRAAEVIAGEYAPFASGSNPDEPYYYI